MYQFGVELILNYIPIWSWISGFFITLLNGWYNDRILDYEGRWEFYQEFRPNYRLVLKCVLVGHEDTALCKNKIKSKAMSLASLNLQETTMSMTFPERIVTQLIVAMIWSMGAQCRANVGPTGEIRPRHDGPVAHNLKCHQGPKFCR